tara:strand:- start:327 stop:1043 length:717 start_codon:yes stop_codon:yes gene_type:complete
MKIDLYEDGIGFVEYDQHMGDDVTIVNAARVSFGKKKDTLDERDQKLIRYLIKHRHTSTLEHNVVTFRIKVPIFIARQHHRHRTWSYNEISRRYTDVNIQFYETSELRSQHKSNRQASNLDNTINPRIEVYNEMSSVPFSYLASDLIRDHHKSSLRLFDNLLDAGICREQARGVLPQNMYTEYLATVNLNNLIKFINLRTHEGAQKEIVDLANGMIEICKEFWPNIFDIYEEFKNEDK